MHKSKKMGKLLLTILFLFLSLVANSQTAESVLENYFKATGGKERWRQLNSIVLTYEMLRANRIPRLEDTNIRYDSGLFFTVAKRKESINLVRHVGVFKKQPMDTTTTTFNGKEFWIQYTSDEEPNSGGVDIKDVSRNSTLGHPDKFIMADSFTYLGGIQQIDGSTCHIVRVTSGRSEMDYYFDTTTHLLMRYHPKDKTLTTTLRDYKDVHGLKIPFVEVLSNEFGIINRNQLVDTRMNVLIEDLYFSKVIGEGLMIR